MHMHMHVLGFIIFLCAVFFELDCISTVKFEEPSVHVRARSLPSLLFFSFPSPKLIFLGFANGLLVFGISKGIVL